jgi:hypothetical protein
MSEVKTGKDFKIFGVRAQLIGDLVMAIPLLTLLEKKYPNSYKYWCIAKKVSQSADLFRHHPLIDEIFITKGMEGPEGSDYNVIDNCNLVLNVNPSHPDDRFPNFFNIWEETARMADFSMDEYNLLTEEEKRPKLVKWFDVENLGPKTIACWPVAGYAKWPGRSPSKQWYEKLFIMLYSMGFTIYQFGHPNDYTFNSHPQHIDCRHLSFFDQVKKTLGTSIALATDSGISLVIGAYSFPQISLLTNHWRSPRHVRNFYAFGTNNPNNYSFFGMNHCDNISQGEVIAKILEKTSLQKNER